MYKLTDFGYAKSYDKSSVCTSLVGTVQYVVSVCMITLVPRLLPNFVVTWCAAESLPGNEAVHVWHLHTKLEAKYTCIFCCWQDPHGPFSLVIGNSLVPRPRTAFHRLQYGKVRE